MTNKEDPPNGEPGATQDAGSEELAGSPTTTNRRIHYRAPLRHNDPLQRRRAAARRLPPLGRCGCIHDPLHDRHRCGDEITDNLVDGYRDAVRHLRGLGLPAAPFLPEMRALWRRGPEERRLVAEITERWDLAG
jgi:hypothetical protein